MSGIWAKSVLASRHAITGVRLDTILVRFPRIILAECNTHRALSKNTASSRALPISKMIEQVEKDPFVPEIWTSHRPGMQGGADHNAALLWPSPRGDSFEPKEIDRVDAWLWARDQAVKTAWAFHRSGYSKQIVNRLLEPWMWTIALWSGTEWDNFFALRDHPAAEPHMQLLAKAIRATRELAPVQVLEPGKWHLPFVNITDEDGCPVNISSTTGESLRNAQILSVARCASTSYRTTDGFDMTMERAESIFAKLAGPPLHASPLEHVAQADWWMMRPAHMPGGEFIGNVHDYANPEDHRNFKGFRQLRAQIERAA